jgi:ribosomal protection tetracycline resistance protein
VTRSGYSAPSTGPGDFRRLTPLVLMSALSEAGTQVCEPVHRFRLDGPADSLQPALRALARLRVDPHETAISGSTFAVEGELPAGRVHLLQRQVGALTRGEGVLEVAFSHYEPVAGEVPTRARTDHNPLNRADLLHVARRVS